MSDLDEQTELADAPDASEARTKIRAYIVGNFLLGSSADFRDDTQLMESGVLDSTAVMELVTFLEETFQFQIDDDDITPENLNSIDNIASFVAKNMG